MQTQEPLIHTPCRISTLFAAVFPVSPSVSQGSAEDSKMTQEALSFLRSPELPPLKDHLFCCLKMFPACCRMTKAGLLRPFSVRWMSWGKAMYYLHLAAEHGNQYAAQLIHSIRVNGNWTAALASLRLLGHMARVIQNRLEDERRGRENSIDRKLRRKIEEKKQAHGLKQ